jgi:hypothetical protein
MKRSIRTDEIYKPMPVHKRTNTHHINFLQNCDSQKEIISSPKESTEAISAQHTSRVFSGRMSSRSGNQSSKTPLFQIRNNKVKAQTNVNTIRKVHENQVKIMTLKQEPNQDLASDQMKFVNNIKYNL